MPMFNSGHANWAAMITPTSMPTMPYTTATTENHRTTPSV